jgi:hypothetical protein
MNDADPCGSELARDGVSSVGIPVESTSLFAGKPAPTVAMVAPGIRYASKSPVGTSLHLP